MASKVRHLGKQLMIFEYKKKHRLSAKLSARNVRKKARSKSTDTDSREGDFDDYDDDDDDDEDGDDDDGTESRKSARLKTKAVPEYKKMAGLGSEDSSTDILTPERPAGVGLKRAPASTAPPRKKSKAETKESSVFKSPEFVPTDSDSDTIIDKAEDPKSVSSPEPGPERSDADTIIDTAEGRQSLSSLDPGAEPSHTSTPRKGTTPELSDSFEVSPPPPFPGMSQTEVPKLTFRDTSFSELPHALRSCMKRLRREGKSK